MKSVVTRQNSAGTHVRLTPQALSLEENLGDPDNSGNLRIFFSFSWLRGVWRSRGLSNQQPPTVGCSSFGHVIRMSKSVSTQFMRAVFCGEAGFPVRGCRLSRSLGDSSELASYVKRHRRSRRGGIPLISRTRRTFASHCEMSWFHSSCFKYSSQGDVRSTSGR
jgi:hypothetical protein